MEIFVINLIGLILRSCCGFICIFIGKGVVSRLTFLTAFGHFTVGVALILNTAC